MNVSFPAFFHMWAERMRWDVPDCHWLANRGDLAVLRCFRGFGKSTILAAYNAWRYHQNRDYRILHQSESDGTAYKTSRDTQNVIRNHPLTRGMLPDKQGTIEQWWVDGVSDFRNASMYARGILSNVTSARADECQNDDVEVPKNITTPEAREKLRYRLEEQTHILVPGGRKLFIGTPHTHDSIYDELENMGADCLTIPLFSQAYRIEEDAATRTHYELPLPLNSFSSGSIKAQGYCNRTLAEYYPGITDEYQRVIMSGELPSAAQVRTYIGRWDSSNYCYALSQEIPAGPITASVYRAQSDSASGIGVSLISVEVGTLATSPVTTSLGSTGTRTAARAAINTMDYSTASIFYSDGTSVDLIPVNDAVSVPLASRQWGGRYVTSVKLMR